jgi:hypothetical protein
VESEEGVRVSIRSYCMSPEFSEFVGSSVGFQLAKGLVDGFVYAPMLILVATPLPILFSIWGSCSQMLTETSSFLSVQRRLVTSGHRSMSNVSYRSIT